MKAIGKVAMWPVKDGDGKTVTAKRDFPSHAAAVAFLVQRRDEAAKAAAPAPVAEAAAPEAEPETHGKKGKGK